MCKRVFILGECKLYSKRAAAADAFQLDCLFAEFNKVMTMRHERDDGSSSDRGNTYACQKGT